MRASLLALSSALALLLSGGRARAVDPYEIQVYDGTSNAPWSPGIELHVNNVANGVRASDPPQLAPHGQTHFTLEPSLGITPYWELGAYLQSTLRSDGVLDYAGTKLRSKFVTPPGWRPHLRLGVNLELSLLPEKYERDRWGSEVRPIAAWENDRWLLAVNPIVTMPLAGEGYRAGPAFEPALMAVVKIEDVVGLGLEYYASLGPIASPSKLDGQEHYLYEVANLLAVDDLELNVGVGEGLTSASNKIVLKMIVGYSWDTQPRQNTQKSALFRPLRRNGPGLSSPVRGLR